MTLSRRIEKKEDREISPLTPPPGALGMADWVESKLAFKIIHRIKNELCGQTL